MTVILEHVAPKAKSEPRRNRRRSRRRVGEDLSRGAYIAVSVSAMLTLLAVWWLVTALEMVNPLFLPRPDEVLATLRQGLASGELADDVIVSTFRIGSGFLVAAAMSIPIGILIGTDARIEAAIEPIVDFIRYMPVVAFIPLTILWIGTAESQKILIIWMGTFFQLVLLVADAVRRTPSGLVALGETLGLNRLRVLVRIVLPSSAPGIWDALRVSLGWAWTWVVVAELVAADSGMGYRIITAQRYFATDTIIGYVLVLGLLGLVTDQVMRWLGRRMFPYLKGRQS